MGSLQVEYPIPTLKPATEGNFPFTPKGIDQWLESLPAASPWRLTEQVFDKLHEINRQDLRPLDRLDFLGAAARRTGDLFDSQHAKLGEIAVPLRPHELEQAELLMLLHEEMALTYRLAMTYIPGPNDPPVDRAELIRRALYHLAQYVKITYLIKTSVHDRIWGKIYALYRHARHIGCADTVSGEAAETVESTFKTAVLLSLIAPSSLRGAELNAVCKMLPGVAAHATLNPLSDQEAAGALYLIDLEQKTPPPAKPLGAQPHGGHSSRFLLLDVAPAITELKRRLYELQQEKVRHIKPSIGNIDTVRKLLHLLGAERKRRTRRMRGEFEVEVVAGLKDVHRFIKGAEAADSADGGEANDKEQSSRPGISYNLLLNLEKVTIENPFDMDEEERPKTSFRAHAIQSRHTHCQTVNFSSGGYCLKTGLRKDFRLHLGEFVIVREAESGRWLPGSISWLSTTRSHLLFGVRLLAPQFGAGRLLTSNGGRRATGDECLFLLDMDASEDLRLLLPPQQIAIGTCLTVELGDRVMDVVLAKRLFQSNGYLEFLCGEVKMHETPPPASPIDFLADTEILELDDDDGMHDRDSKTGLR